MSEVTNEGPDNRLADDPACDDGEGFLERWSRRKTEATRTVDEPPAEPTDDVSATAAETHDATTTTTDESPVEPELPPLDSLDENSNYSAFLAPGVSSDLKRQALRQLFQSPKFNIRDGLDDYDLDFTSFEPLGDIITADMRHRMLRGLEKLAELDDAADDGTEEPLTDESADSEQDDDDAAPA